MRGFRDWPIRRKLRWIVMCACSAAMLTACVVFVFYEQNTLYSSFHQSISIQAQMMADGCKATLAFDAPDEARESLALLRAEPAITYACLFDKKGKIFAEYRRKDTKEGKRPADLPEGDSFRFDENSLALFKGITLKGESLGRLYIRAELTRLRALLWQRILAAVVATFAACLLVYLVIDRFQGWITGPLKELVTVTQQVTKEQDFSVRAAKVSGDEVGLLVDSFNSMTSDLLASNRQLAEAHDALKQSKVKVIYLLSEQKTVDEN